jgi:hypothetical protein
MKVVGHTVLEDGSLLYDEPIPVNSEYWKVDPENPRRIIPQVPTCQHRRITLRMLQCGRSRSSWNCSHFNNKMISVVDCHKCQVPLTNL